MMYKKVTLVFIFLILIPGISCATSGFITRTGVFFILEGLSCKDTGQNASSIVPGEPIKLYTKWVSSSPLDFAIISTNETGAWKNYTDGTYNSSINMTGYSFWSNFTWSNSSIFEDNISWRIYANDTGGREETTNVMTFIVATTTTTTSTTTTVAAGGGGGGGGPPGEERPEVVGNFTVIPDFVKVIINQGDTKTRNVEVLNTGKEEIEINIDTENLDKFLLLDTNKLNLKPGEKKIS